MDHIPIPEPINAFREIRHLIGHPGSRKEVKGKKKRRCKRGRWWQWAENTRAASFSPEVSGWSLSSMLSQKKVSSKKGTDKKKKIHPTLQVMFIFCVCPVCCIWRKWTWSSEQGKARKADASQGRNFLPLLHCTWWQRRSGPQWQFYHSPKPIHIWKRELMVLHSVPPWHIYSFFLRVHDKGGSSSVVLSHTAISVCPIPHKDPIDYKSSYTSVQGQRVGDPGNSQLV